MKVLVTGVKGQLGYDVVQVLQDRDIECKGVDIDDFDITNKDAVREYILAYAPDTVVHCSAYTAVDKAEDAPELCRAVNVTGVENIAEVSREIDAKMVYISTDYVFPGTGETAYSPDDKTGPLSVYGKTKRDGEEAAISLVEKLFIIRISWVFGINGNNFIKTMLRLSKENDEVRVVGDQFGSPTYTADLAILIADMIATDKYGVYHATNEGICSWADFAEEVFRQAGLPTRVTPIRTEDYPTKAVRPKNSRMDKSCLTDAGFSRLPTWKDAVRRYLNLLAICEKSQ